MRKWLSGGVSPCQGEGRGFESRLALSEKNRTVSSILSCFFRERKRSRPRDSKSPLRSGPPKTGIHRMPWAPSYAVIPVLYSNTLMLRRFEVFVSLQPAHYRGPPDVVGFSPAGSVGPRTDVPRTSWDIVRSIPKKTETLTLGFPFL